MLVQEQPKLIGSIAKESGIPINPDFSQNWEKTGSKTAKI